MAISKPTVDSASWGNTNTSSPDMVTPGAGLVNTGFLAYPTKLKRGYLNWAFNKFHQSVRYLMARGIPDWDASEANYVVGSVVSWAGVCYILNVATPAGTNPATDTAHWGLLVPSVPGILLRRTTLTGTSLAAIAGCKRARIRMVGGGAGAAGCFPNTNTTFASGGAGSGAWAEFETTVIPATWSFAIGAAGVGGAAPVSPLINPGTAGTASTLSDGTNTFTCPGGQPATDTPGAAGGTIPTASPGGTIITAAAGQSGGDGDSAGISGPVASGSGGSTPFGAGGPQKMFSAASAASDGVDGTGHGAGGSGTATVSGSGRKGGSGTTGLIVLEEWS